jgi:hypothetical protein
MVHDLASVIGRQFLRKTSLCRIVIMLLPLIAARVRSICESAREADPAHSAGLYHPASAKQHSAMFSKRAESVSGLA